MYNLALAAERKKPRPLKSPLCSIWIKIIDKIYQSELIEIELREIDLIFSQGHTRMQIVAQLSSLSVTLSAIVLGIFVTLISVCKDIPIFWFVFTPLPFLVFAFLILREDLPISGTFLINRTNNLSKAIYV